MSRILRIGDKRLLLGNGLSGSGLWVPPNVTPPSGDFPNASNTGIPAGTVLTNYTGPMTITANGTVIQDKIITGTLNIACDTFTLRRCRLTFGGAWGVDGYGSKYLTVEDCEIIGPGASGEGNGPIAGGNDGLTTVLRTNIKWAENGIVLNSGAALIKDTFIHELLSSAGSGGHYDGIACHGTQNGVTIDHCTIEARDTSNIFFKNDYAPSNTNLLVQNCLLRKDTVSGANRSYAIFAIDGNANVGPPTNVKVYNNVIESGPYANPYFSFEGTVDCQGNTDFVTGANIDSWG